MRPSRARTPRRAGVSARFIAVTLALYLAGGALAAAVIILISRAR